MKKTLLLIALISTMVTAASAQTEFRGWTVKAGVNYSTFMGGVNADLPTKPKVGFIAGLAFDWSFGKVFGLSADVLYSTQGAIADLSRFKEGVKVQENVSYLNIPIQANVYITKGLVGKAGIQVSYVLTATDEISGTDKPQDFDLISRYNVIDLSIPVSLAYEFDFGLVVEARYNFGVMNIVNQPAPILEGIKAYNSFATLTLGYRF